MKPVRSAANSAIEPLEARIAPATIRIGAQGVFENITDTEYHEAIDINVPGQDLPRPEEFGLLSFTDTNTSLDPLSLSLNAHAGNTFVLRLKKGDVVERFSETGNYKTFINVTAGNVVAFFTDLNLNNEFDDGELTGIALGKAASVQISGSVNGDIASNLDERGTKDIADDRIDMTGLVSTKQGITNLSVLGGSVFGNVYSAGDIKNTVFANDVQSILAGTAADGESFDFFTGSAGGKGSFTVAPAPGVAGASITNLLVKSITVRVEAGGGGASGKGGSISNVQVTGDTDGFLLLAGKGGDGDAASKKINGGVGGSVQNVIVNGLLDPTPNSLGGIAIAAGKGGDGLSTGKGGSGGNVSKIQVGFESTPSGVVPSALLLSDSVSLFGGSGGAGKTGGTGGSVTDSKVRVRAPEVNGVEISVISGDGGSSLSPSGKAGAGGSAKNLDLRNQSIVFGTDILVQSGRGGNTVGDGIGAAGGSILNITTLSFDQQFIAGNGSDGKTGGIGGSVQNLILLSDENVRTHNLLVDAGKGGNGTAGNGGNAGNITTVKADVVDLTSLVINDGVKGNGGDSVASPTKSGLKGGKGGAVSGIVVGDDDSDAQSEGFVAIRSGNGGSGDLGGGAGGNISNIDLSATDLSFTVTGGSGGDATLKGKGGGAGTISVTQILTNGFVAGLPVTGSVTSGQGGDGKGANGAGGSGGTINVLRISSDGDTSVIAGAGGSGETGATGGAAGSGGSLIAVGTFAETGSATMRAGDAGALGVKPGNGGTIKGENVSKDPNAEPLTIIGVRAAKSITIIAGSGTHGGSGGDITGITYGSTAQILLPTPSGNIIVAAGNGSAEGKSAGHGGSIDRLDGSISSGVNTTTTITAGDGGGFGGAVKAGVGGSIRNVAISRGGNTGVLFTVKAGDAGDASGGSTGVAGGSVQNFGVTDIDTKTIFRSVAAGDGGDGAKKGGPGGSVTGLAVQAHDIGFRTGQVFGYTTQGGIFAGVGGTAGPGGKAGLNGSVIDVSADAIASIVAGRTATPQLVEKASGIKVNGAFTSLLYNLNSIFPGTGAFQIRFGPNPGDITPVLPANATVKEVQDALNNNPTIQSQGGVTVTPTRSLGYQIRWNTPGAHNDLIAVETVSVEVTEQVKGSTSGASTTETKSGQVNFNPVENRSGLGSLDLLEIIPGQQFIGSTEVSQAVAVTGPGESQQINTSFLASYPTGSFVLSFNGETGATVLDGTSTAADVETALNAMGTIVAAGRVSVVAGSQPHTFVVSFLGDADNNGFPDDVDGDGIPGDLFVPQNPITGTAFVPETQRLDLSPISNIAGSTFTLSYLGNTSVIIPSTATVADIQAALNPIVALAGDAVTVSEFSPGIFDITFASTGDKAEILSATQVTEIQTLTLGNFVSETPANLYVFYGTERAGPLSPTLNAADLDAALESLPSIGADGVTVVSAPNNSFVITFATNGQKQPLIGLGTVQEHQQLDLTSIINSPTSEFQLQPTTFAGVNETNRGAAISLPTSTTSDGRIRTITAVTNNEGSAGNFEEQEIQIPLPIYATPGAEFYLFYTNPVTAVTKRTAFLPVTATAADVQAALRAIDADVTVTSPQTADFVIDFGAHILNPLPNPLPPNFVDPELRNEQQITGFAGVREVQTLSVSPISSNPGAEFTLTVTNGELTAPIAVPATPAAIQNELNLLPDIALVGGVTVTQPVLNNYVIKANDFGNLSQLVGNGGGTAEHEVQVLDLNPYATQPNVIFNVSFGGETTPLLAGTATATDIENALNGLASVQALRADGSGAVTVMETVPHVFSITFNVFNDQASVVGVLGLDDTTTAPLDFTFSQRLAYNATAADVKTSIESVSLQTVTVNPTATPGVFDIVFDQLGDQPLISGFISNHEQQKLDVYAVGNFTAIFDNQSQTIDLNPLTPGLNDLPENATAADVLAALLSIPSIQALPVVHTGQPPISVTTNPDSSYTIVFNNVDGDVAFLGADQFENFTVQTLSNTALKTQILTPIVKGEFLASAFASASLVGAVVDINEIDSNIFKFIHQGTVYSAAQRAFELGDTPIDGILMAKVFDQNSANFTPEARLTAAGFFDNDNLIS
jgi:hypothetical protein